MVRQKGGATTSCARPFSTIVKTQKQNLTIISSDSLSTKKMVVIFLFAILSHLFHVGPLQRSADLTRLISQSRCYCVAQPGFGAYSANLICILDHKSFTTHGVLVYPFDSLRKFSLYILRYRGSIERAKESA